MIREALEKDAESIVYINVNSWKNTYKNIFPQNFLDNLDPININNIENYILIFDLCIYNFIHTNNDH